MLKLARILIAISIMLIPSIGFAGAIAVAPVATPTFTSSHETSGSIGLRFEFGDTIKPSIVGAVRSTQTDTGNGVKGALIDVAVPIVPGDGFLPVIRIMGIFGNTNVQGLAGIGYDFGENQGVIGLGLQGPYVDAGANFGLKGTVAPYVGISTYKGPPARGTTVAPVVVVDPT